MVETSSTPVRYAVVGLGHIAQAAVLPAFANAENSQLTALVSSDEVKLAKLGARYDVGSRHRYNYENYDDLLADDLVDAVYIAVPNHLHRDYVIRSAEAGIHVLCEKPLGVTADECREMVEVCDDVGVQLMTAYRLHFEAANMEAVNTARRGDIGNMRYFQASFSQNVTSGDIRLMPIEKGGGSVYDMGVYCINAARYLFGSDPTQVLALSESKTGDERFSDCDEMTGAIMRFPDSRIASFTTSFGAHHTSTYRLVGDEGEIILDPAFEYASNLSYEIHAGDTERSETLEKRDQFGPELVYFSECINQGILPEPDGYEGWGDVQVIEAIYESANTGQAVDLDVVEPPKRPDVNQVISRPGFDKPDEVRASGPKE